MLVVNQWNANITCMGNGTTRQTGREISNEGVLFKKVGSKLRGHMHRVTSAGLSDHVPDSIGDAILPEAEKQDELSPRIAAIPAAENVPLVGSPGMAKTLDVRFAPQRGSLSLPSSNLETLIFVRSANAARQAQAMSAKVAGSSVVYAASARESCPQAVRGMTRREAITL
ncbi:MAG: hypothetical protein AAFR73_10935 [Pseudomonadota bacterium]